MSKHDVPPELKPATRSSIRLIVRRLDEHDRAFDESEPCETCLGTGISEKEKGCDDCNGTGLISAW